MRKFTFLTLAAVTLAGFFYLASCTKDNPKEPATLTNEQALELLRARAEQTTLLFEKAGAFAQDPTTGSQNQSAEDRATCNRVPLCHNGNQIVVNKSAVPAHLAHGDQLTCCETSCINESAELRNGGPYNWYYDMSVWDCFEYEMYGVDSYVAIAYAGGYIAAEAFTHHGTTYYFVYSHLHENHSYPCDEMVTQAEYECAIAYLRSVVAANTCIPNLCDLHHH